MEKGEEMNTEFDEFITDFINACSKAIDIPTDILTEDFIIANDTLTHKIHNDHNRKMYHIQIAYWKEKFKIAGFRNFLKSRIPTFSLTQINQIIINNSHFDHNYFN